MTRLDGGREVWFFYTDHTTVSTVHRFDALTRGVHVVANLRGGGEEGEDWYRAGMRALHQNMFDDFDAVAARLVADGWTTPGQLASWGGSNGGLLVGSALTQRPNLFAAAVCSAPLLGYSPHHAALDASEPTAYPATLFTVFEGDTRVDPLHARKLAAALQVATKRRRERRVDPRAPREGRRARWPRAVTNDRAHGRTAAVRGGPHRPDGRHSIAWAP